MDLALSAGETMRAAVVTGPGRISIEDVPKPEPGPGQVRVRLEGCGVCASNLTPWAGPDWMRFPTEPGALGHEGWGVVDARGEGVDEISVGDRVAALSYNSYAEFDLAEARAVVPLPDRLADAPFPGEPLGCAMNIWRRSDIQKNQNVAIIGIGFLGALLTQLASKAGASVIAISRRPWSLELAKLMGASDTIELDRDDSEIVARVEELTDGQGCERVIEVVGLQRPLDLATKLARVRGKIIIAGFHQDGPRTIDMFQWNWRGLDVVNAHERDPREYLAGMRAAIDAVSTGQLDPRPLYTHKVPLAEAGRAFELLRTRPDGFVKVLVTP
jgi:threonine dehydrogenase-like Zn-dependent dehydrogenase